jgi:hypothetical protein
MGDLAMPVRGAALEWRVQGAPGSRSLVVTAHLPDGPRDVDAWPVKEAEVGAVYEALRRTLTEIHDLAGDDLEPPAEAARSAATKLLELSSRVAYGLFGSRDRSRLHEAARLLAPGALDPGTEPRIVEVCTPPDFDYPFELFAWRPTDGIQDFRLSIRRLLGMSAVVRRRIQYLNEPQPDQTIANDPVLPLTIFEHPGLTESSERESEYLSQLTDLISVYGPWPRAGDLAADDAVRHLLQSRVSLDGSPRSCGSSVIHLACHCDTEQAVSDDYVLRIGARDGGDIRLGRLKTLYESPESMAAPIPRPLVFLNACGTAVPQGAERTSFTEFFLDRQSLGVVGTLCDISNDVAAHFARVFYEALLRGETVGQAMYAARWHLMERHGNPLGILYTFHGNPDLKLARPRPGAVPPACERESI